MGDVTTTMQALDLLRRRHRLPTEQILTDGLIPVANRIARLDGVVVAARRLLLASDTVHLRAVHEDSLRTALDALEPKEPTP